MSQIIRATFSPAVPGQGNTRKVARSGRRYMSDSSMRTKPSIEEPSNMILPSSASSNCRSGISTFLIVPRMSVNCRRMNLTFSRSVRSRICAFVSRADVCLAMIEARRLLGDCSQLFAPDSRLKPMIGRQGMKLLKITGVFVALAGVAVLALVAAPFDSRALAQGRPERDLPERRGGALTVLAGRGAEIGISIADGSNGVVVEEVRPDSPAEKAGLKRSDVIVEFDGERVRSARQFGRLVQETPLGRTVKATVTREGQRQDVQITPTEDRGSAMIFDGDRIREQMGDLAGRFRDNFNFDFDLDGRMSGGRLGVTVQELTKQLADYFGAKDGVLVTAVTDGSAAARAGLKAGDVITSINSRAVASREDLVRSLRDADGDEVTIGFVR